MRRTLKIMVAFCCVIVGTILTQSGQTIADAGELSPVFVGFGFLLTMVAGLYSFLKIMRPLIS
jgi:hypothetical protein